MRTGLLPSVAFKVYDVSKIRSAGYLIQRIITPVFLHGKIGYA